jgi:hypothetical protein
MDVTEMNREEVSTFASKLDAFGQQLSVKEQALLQTILRRAAAARVDDVEGYDFNTFINPETPHADPQGAANAWTGQGGPRTPTQDPTNTVVHVFHFNEFVPNALGYESTYDWTPNRGG